jgi:predicted metal-dependent hydrolase
LKRHSPRGNSPRPAPSQAPTKVPTVQLSLPLGPGNPGAGDARSPSGVRSQSRRALRPAQAARQVRLGPTIEEETDHVATALALYLPPGKTLELRLTNNHYSMISVRRKPDGYRLRLHRMFVGAEPRTVRALARYVVHNDRRASTLLGDYIEEHQHIIRQQRRRPRQMNLRTVGRYHDLQAIFDRLNVEHFGGNLQARITWGPVAARGKRRRSIKMGSFAVEDRIIRIHPALDQECVPDYFVAWIIFHEMLHGKHEVKRENGRRRFHSAEFLAEERSFPEYPRACAWEKQNLDRLLRG